MPKKVLIIVKNESSSKAFAKEFAKTLEEYKIETILFFHKSNIPEIPQYTHVKEQKEKLKEEKKEKKLEEIGFAVSIGGDGTYLEALRQICYLSDIPVAAIATGTVNFIAAYPKSQKDILAQKISNYLKAGQLDALTHVDVLIAKIIGKDGSTFSISAFNEFHIMPAMGKALYLDAFVKVNEKKTLFTNIAANTVLVASPGGSTAQCASMDGAILFPGVEGYQMIVAGQMNNFAHRGLRNPAVFSKEYNLLLYATKRTDVITIAADTKLYNLNDVVSIEISMTKKHKSMQPKQNFAEKISKKIVGCD